jgi:DNA-binding response OmpR family regulator
MAKTRRILIVSRDTEVTGFLKISSMTLTKLNCQVSVEDIPELEEAAKLSGDVNVDLILLDLNLEEFSPEEFLKKIRSEPDSRSKKVIGFYSGEIDKDLYHSLGCDSIMNKNELMKNAVNIIQY